VKPARGGTSDTQRIVYRAAAGEDVYIKGSEPVTGWVKQTGNVYKAVVPNTVFAGDNPFGKNVSGDWMTYGWSYHLGDVYMDGESYAEQLDMNSVGTTPKSWLAGVDASNTTIWANFGGADPAGHLVEVNARKSVFAPIATGVSYLTVDGFHMMHAAPNWDPPGAVQEGLLSTNWGGFWIIQNNHVSDAKTVGILSGSTGNFKSPEMGRAGSHVARNNTVQRCGEAGIAGWAGWTASLIENNLIEDVNVKRQFGGYETAGIKIHCAIDVTIKNNVIRRVYSNNYDGGSAHDGIWLDWQGQGSRITGNVIYDIEQYTIYLEMDHGPQLIDNNILVGDDRSFSIGEHSEHGVFVHNLMYKSSWMGVQTDSRSSEYYTAHTSTRAGSSTQNAANDRYLNNIYVQQGTDAIWQASGYQSDYNVYYDGARATSWGDAHSISNTNFAAGMTLTTVPTGVVIVLHTDSAPVDVAAPLVTRALSGINPLTKQGIENHDGSPITIDKDMAGAARSTTHPTAGPFEALASGAHTFTFLAGADETGSVWGAPGNVAPDAGAAGAGGGGGRADAGQKIDGAAGGAGAGAAGAGGGGGRADAGQKLDGSAQKDGAAAGGGGAGGSPTGDDPSLDAEDPGAANSSGCGCRTAGNAPPTSVAFGCALGLAALVRRRRR
jgi:MYXO-CTERM domain-containing protein